MSSIIVDHDTMHRAVWAVLNSRREFHGVEIGWDETAGTKIGRLLYAMNETAMAERYGPGWQGEWDGAHSWAARASDAYDYAQPFDFAPVGELGMMARMRAVRSLSCLLYQCAEGQVPDTVLFEDLRALMHELAFAVLQAMPAYNALDWN